MMSVNVVDVPRENAGIIDLPAHVYFVRLNADGTYEDAAALSAKVFIEETQVHKLSDPDISSYIRQVYGDIVGIICNKTYRLGPPNGGSRMFVLGA